MTTRKAANGEKAKQELLKTLSADDVERVIIAELDLGWDPRTMTDLIGYVWIKVSRKRFDRVDRYVCCLVERNIWWIQRTR